MKLKNVAFSIAAVRCLYPKILRHLWAKLQNLHFLQGRTRESHDRFSWCPCAKEISSLSPQLVYDSICTVNGTIFAINLRTCVASFFWKIYVKEVSPKQGSIALMCSLWGKNWVTPNLFSGKEDFLADAIFCEYTFACPNDITFRSRADATVASLAQLPARSAESVEGFPPGCGQCLVVWVCVNFLHTGKTRCADATFPPRSHCKCFCLCFRL